MRTPRRISVPSSLHFCCLLKHWIPFPRPGTRTSSSSIGTHPQPLPQHSRKKEGLIHLHLKIMERSFFTLVLCPLTLVKENISIQGEVGLAHKYIYLVAFSGLLRHWEGCVHILFASRLQSVCPVSQSSESEYQGGQKARPTGEGVR